MLRQVDGVHGDYLDLLDVIDENSEDPKADREELFRTAEHGTAVDGATLWGDAVTALLGVSGYFVESAQRDKIFAAVLEALGKWRELADTCRIPAAEIELFAPLLDNPPPGLAR